MKTKHHPKPTPEQIAWLRENYKLYNRDYIAEKFVISQTVLSGWTKSLGLKKKELKGVKLTDEKKEFIRKNFRKIKNEEMAKKMGVSVGAIASFCFRNGLKAKVTSKVDNQAAKVDEQETVTKKILAFKEPPKLKRPAATYSNISREQHVEKWINTDIPAPKGKRTPYNLKKTA